VIKDFESYQLQTRGLYSLGTGDIAKEDKEEDVKP
jgi:hypothetical protein